MTTVNPVSGKVAASYTQLKDDVDPSGVSLLTILSDLKKISLKGFDATNAGDVVEFQKNKVTEGKAYFGGFFGRLYEGVVLYVKAKVQSIWNTLTDKAQEALQSAGIPTSVQELQQKLDGVVEQHAESKLDPATQPAT